MILTAALLGLTALRACALESADFMAGAVVHSKEWKVNRGAEKTEEFIGDVSYSGSGNIIRSDWAFFRHGTRHWEMRGRIHATRRFSNGDKLEAWGQSAEHSLADSRGNLLGPKGAPVRLSLTSADGERHDAEAGRLEWSAPRQIQLLSGVTLRGPRVEAWAGRADADSGLRALELSGGRPVVLYRTPEWTAALKADRILAAEAPGGRGGLEAVGRARGWVHFEKDPAGATR